MEKQKIKLHEYICIECGKHIASISKSQFDYNKGEHIDSHKRKLNLKSKEIKGNHIKEELK